MGFKSKNYKKASEGINKLKKYSVDDSFKFVAENSFVKFDETVDVAINLGINPKHADQMVRSALVLPNGLGKAVKVIVFTAGEKEAEAKDAGAEYVGLDDYIEKIKGGWLDFDKAIATPDVMGKVGKIGKILGTRGLMPNPKVGTVTFDVAQAVKELKAGKVEFRADKNGILHVPIGKVSFGSEKLKENFLALMELVLKLKPQTAKGAYLKGVTMSSTMGVGIKMDPSDVKGYFK